MLLSSQKIQDYIFYFFEFFEPKRPFKSIEVTQKNWGRYDSLSKEQYGDQNYFWIIQLFDSKDDFWEMKYDYNLLIPEKNDIDEYISYLNKYIIYNR